MYNFVVTNTVTNAVILMLFGSSVTFDIFKDSSEGNYHLQKFQKECQQPKPIAMHNKQTSGFREISYPHSYDLHRHATQG